MWAVLSNEFLAQNPAVWTAVFVVDLVAIVLEAMKVF
jgi:hypothetical protein